MYTPHPVPGRSRHSRTLLVPLIAALLLLPACTGSEDTTSGDETTSDSPTTTIEQETEAEAPGSAATEAPDTEAPDDEGAEGAEGDEVAGIDLNADYCGITQQADESGLFAGAGPETPEDLAEAFERTRLVADALVQKAPDEIADDVEITATNLSELMSVLEAHASRTGEVGADAQEDTQVQDAIDALDSEEVQEAQDRVAEWESDNC